MRISVMPTVVAIAALAPGGTVDAAPGDHALVVVGVDSGWIEAPRASVERGVTWSTVVRAPGASWLRLSFDDVVLGDAVLRLESLSDGASQTLDRERLQQWRSTSAYFNGDAVRVKLISTPGAGVSRVTIPAVWAGEAVGSSASICFEDDRVASTDARIARVQPGGCTAWLSPDGCLMSAGHCVLSGFNVIQFNVPPSDSAGALQHPGPEDQYPIDLTSIQFAWGVVGNDWSYFGCFPNSETGLSPLDAQEDFYELVDEMPAASGQLLKVIGYGIDSTPLEANQTQQRAEGPYVSSSGSFIDYAVDTDTGSSGSPVIDDDDNVVIAIHTNGGCSFSGGSNKGTAIDHPSLQAAMATPLGVCQPPATVSFAFPQGLPLLLDLGGQVVTVQIAGQNGGQPVPGSGLLHYDVGEGFTSVPMVEASPDVYEATFPTVECGTTIDYYFSVEVVNGDPATDPPYAPEFSHSGIATDSLSVVFEDDFEMDLGWTVTNSAELSNGAWERGAPAGNGSGGDPLVDADGSGQCFVTENGNGNADVDGGSTTLLSPVMDASRGTPIVRYWRWFSNSAGGHPQEEVFRVEVSADAGETWVGLETVGPAGTEVHGGWTFRQFVVSDFVPLTDQFRIRFTAEDTLQESRVEAAVDGVELADIACQAVLPGDLDGDGSVGTSDLLLLLAAWGSCPAPCPPSCPADLDGDCTVATTDFLLLLAGWG